MRRALLIILAVVAFFLLGFIAGHGSTPPAKVEYRFFPMPTTCDRCKTL